MRAPRWSCTIGGLFALFLATQASCFQELDSQATMATLNPPDAGDGLATSIQPPTVALDPNDDTQTADDPCVKTENDSIRIRQTFCAKCHDQGAASQGVPRFDFLMDDQALINNIWSVGGEQRRFVIPGDPDNSWLFLRPYLGTMPPPSTDVRNPANPAPTISAISVLREWVLNCVGGQSMDAGVSADSGVNDSGTTVMPVDNARYNFEMNAQNWATLPPAMGRDSFTNIATSTVQVYAGRSSLACTITSSGARSYYVEVPGQITAPAGTRITFHVYIPDDADVTLVQPYVGSGSMLMGSTWMYPSTGMWNTLTVVVPQTAQLLDRLGIEFLTGSAYHGTVYVDSINW
jgi:hypothetical protein